MPSWEITKGKVFLEVKPTGKADNKRKGLRDKVIYTKKVCEKPEEKEIDQRCDPSPNTISDKFWVMPYIFTPLQHQKAMLSK